MTYHILNGDALIERFRATGLVGEVVVARECLIEGDLRGDNLPAFFQTRAAYIAATYGENRTAYFARVVTEFEKLQAAPDGSEFNLWFGYDLFCRANMWFVLSLLDDLGLNKKVYAVYPFYLKDKDVWNDFGGATPQDLADCFKNRITLTDADIRLGVGLWKAYKSGDLAALETLSKSTSVAFPYLEEVCKAHIERFPKDGISGRPERVLQDIIAYKTTDFNAVFSEFFHREGIYGFGDSQVKQLYDKVLRNRR
jgi:hypothetical protein